MKYIKKNWPLKEIFRTSNRNENLQVAETIEVQIKNLYLSNLKTPEQDSLCELDKNFCETLYLENTQEKLHLYFGLVTGSYNFCDNITITSLPSLLAKMPKNRTRLAYLKILQVLCGADKEKLEAVEFKHKR